MSGWRCRARWPIIGTPSSAAATSYSSTWFDELDLATKEDVKKLDTAFSDGFVKGQPCWVLEQQLWSGTIQLREGLNSYAYHSH